MLLLDLPEIKKCLLSVRQLKECGSNQCCREDFKTMLRHSFAWSCVWRQCNSPRLCKSFNLSGWVKGLDEGVKGGFLDVFRRLTDTRGHSWNSPNHGKLPQGKTYWVILGECFTMFHCLLVWDKPFSFPPLWTVLYKEDIARNERNDCFQDANALVLRPVERMIEKAHCVTAYFSFWQKTARDHAMTHHLKVAALKLLDLATWYYLAMVDK